MFRTHTWLQSGETDVKRFDSSLKKLKDGRKAGPQHQQDIDSYRSIASFLSKNGKSISYETVRNHLNIFDKLPKDIYNQVKKQTHATGESHDNGIGVKQFDTVMKQKRKGDGKFESSPDSYRSIATFLF